MTLVGQPAGPAGKWPCSMPLADVEMSEVPIAEWSRISTHPYRRPGEPLPHRWERLRAAADSEGTAE